MSAFVYRVGIGEREKRESGSKSAGSGATAAFCSFAASRCWAEVTFVDGARRAEYGPPTGLVQSLELRIHKHGDNSSSLQELPGRAKVQDAEVRLGSHPGVAGVALGENFMKNP
jgi:hypothetical protein